MCGIAGFNLFDQGSDSLSAGNHGLRLALQRLQRRGPDMQDLCRLPNGGIGHCRLAVVDLQSGAQPLRCRESGVVISYNGEVYNHQALRRQLEGHGFRFVSRCDTEVVLAAYRHWGRACVERFHGCFAFAVYDPQEHRLFIARDRLGVKPLFYHEAGDGIYYASTVAALAAMVDVGEIDLLAMSNYLSFGRATIGERTLLTGARLLAPGHWREYRLDDGQVTTHCYWRLPRIAEAEKRKLPFAAAAAMARERITEAVTERLMADVPVGTFLSGGLDSAIVSHCTTAAGHRLASFCAGSDDEASNEFAYAEQMADRIGSSLEEVRVSAAHAGEDWGMLLRERGLPLTTPNEMSIYRLASALRQQCTVALTGEGADEIFGGYVLPQFGVMDAVRAARSEGEVVTDDPLATALSLHYGRAWFFDDLDHYFTDCAWLPFAQKQRLLRDDCWQSLEGDVELCDFYAEVFDELDACTPIDRRMHVVARYNLENLLLRVDSSTMAASVEGRVPFTDHRLVEFAFQLPDKHKIDWHNLSAVRRSRHLTVAQMDEAGLLATKRIPRHAFHAVLPRSIVERKKMSFPVPFRDWCSNELGEQVRHHCLESDIATHYFKREQAEQLLQSKHPAIWLLSNLSMWMETLGELRAEAKRQPHHGSVAVSS